MQLRLRHSIFSSKCFSVANDILYLETGGVKRQVVPEFDHELRDHLLRKFHGEKHFEYQKTFNLMYEQYVGREII